MMSASLFTAGRLRLIAAAIVVLNGFFPAAWILLTSFKPQLELVRKPITYWPREFTNCPVEPAYSVSTFATLLPPMPW